MMPHPYLLEKLMFERAQELQREIEQRHLLADLRRSHPGVLSHTIQAMASSVSFMLREKALRAVTIQHLRFLTACCLRQLVLFCMCVEILL